jgi:hypothetical protein
MPTAFPDMRFETVQTLAADDWVITKMRWTGTFQARFDFIGFNGIEPNGRTFDVEHAHAFRLAEARSPSTGPSGTISPCTTSSSAAEPHDTHHLSPGVAWPRSTRWRDGP